MSTQTIRIPTLAHDEQNMLDQLVLQWRAKRTRNALRAGFYDMQNATEKLMPKAAPETVQRRRYVLGWSAMAVDKLARRCNLDGVYDQGGIDLDTLGMREIWRTNRLRSEISQAGVSGLIHSVAWLIATQGDTQAGEPKALITARDALTGTGIWSARRRAMVSFLSINELDDDGEPTDMTMYRPNQNIFMTKTPTSPGGWKVTWRSHRYGVPVDPMRYKPRIGRPFGSSRITRAGMSIHMQALATMIRADVNGEAYSLPRYALLGAGEEAFRNADGSPKPTWQAAWDAIWAIGDDDTVDDPKLARADIKQFHGQSPEPQNSHLRMLAQMFSGETGIPLGELGIVGDSNPTSYDALLASRDDIISTADATVEDWDPDVSSSITRALAMFNDNDLPANLDVRGQWRPTQHASRAAAADAGAKVLAAAPWIAQAESDVALELLGLRPDQITRVNNDRQRAAGRALVNRLRTGLPAAGAAPAANQSGQPDDGSDDNAA